MPQSDGYNILKRMEFEFQGMFYEFAVNPQEYSQDEGTRSSINQTKAGAWIDDFGAALPSIYIKGTTGFDNGKGFERMKDLRDKIRSYYNARQPGEDVKDELLFHNLTDEESWVVHIDPNNGFRILRSVQSPLLYMYEIRMACLRKAQIPAGHTKVEIYEARVGNPYGSSLPKSETVPNVESTQLYEYAEPYFQNVLGADANGQAPSVVGDYFSQGNILNDGRLQVYNTSGVSGLSMMALAAPNPTEPVLNPYISNLSLNVYKNLKSQLGNYSNGGTLPKDSLISKITKNQNVAVTSDVQEVVRASLLETFAIHNTLATNPSSLGDNVSQSDLLRLAQNIRWATYKLADIQNFDLEIVEGLRWLERAVMYVQRSSGLFSKDYKTTMDDYSSAIGG